MFQVSLRNISVKAHTRSCTVFIWKLSGPWNVSGSKPTSPSLGHTQLYSESRFVFFLLPSYSSDLRFLLSFCVLTQSRRVFAADASIWAGPIIAIASIPQLNRQFHSTVERHIEYISRLNDTLFTEAMCISFTLSCSKTRHVAEETSRWIPGTKQYLCKTWYHVKKE